MRVRPSTRGNGIHFAVDGPHRILDCALLESLDVGHLHGRIQGGLLCKQGGIDYGYPVIRVVPTSHARKRSLTAHQSYLDIDAVDQEFILQIRVSVGRRGHERAVQVDVDLTEQRMQLVTDRTHGIGQVEIVPVGSRHLHMHV